MKLPKRIPKAPKRESRWRSQAHCNFVRSHACSVCFSEVYVQVAHVRLGTNTGMGQKPDDWNTVSLCERCHYKQHVVGEATFWKEAKINPLDLAAEFAKESPRAREIADAKRERGL